MALGSRFKPFLVSANCPRGRFYAAYTVLFAIVALAVFFPFIFNGRSFVFADSSGGGDGLVQHFNAFCYYGMWLRDIARNLLFEHALVVPMWDMSIGYGQDVITTLSYYVIGDPFSFLSIAIPRRFAEAGYCALIVLRMYCAGIAFCMFCRSRKLDTHGTLIGSIVYVFCFYALSSGVLHPYFLLPMIWLPLLLMGVDKVLDGKSGLQYALVYALAGISNFYFFYMLTIIVLLYTIVRYAKLYGSFFPVKRLLKHIARMLAYSLLGAGVAAVLLLPSMMSILSASRVNVDNYVPLLYALHHYVRAIPAFINGGYGNYTYMGFTVVGWVSACLLVLRYKQSREHKFLVASFLVLMLFLGLPFIGHVFNGFGYVTNRWSWALAFLVAYIIAFTVPHLGEITQSERKAILIISAIAAVPVLAIPDLCTEKNVLAFGALFFLLAVMFYLIDADSAKRHMTKLLYAIVAVGVASNAFYLYSPSEENYLKNFTEYGRALKMLTVESPGYVLKGVSDGELFRYDCAGLNTGEVKRNSAMQLDLNGIAYYFSTTNSAVSAFARELELNYSMDQTYNDLNRRSVLERIACVRYVLSIPDKEKYLPLGYEKKALEGKRFNAYEGSSVLSFGFATDKVVSTATFEEANVVDKERLLSTGIVYDGTEENLGLGSGHESTLDYKVEYGEGVHVDDDGSIVIEKDDSTVKLTFDPIEDRELYVEFNKFAFSTGGPLADANAENGGVKETLARFVDALRWKEPTCVAVNVSDGNSTTGVEYRTLKDNYYCGRDTFIGNLGFLADKRSEITLTFNKAGTYSFDSISLYAPSRTTLDEDIANLNAIHMENVNMVPNGISGSISLPKEGVLCMQIPYSSGWTARIDGEKASLDQADVMFVGMKVPAGSHEIQLTYRTPYLFEGAAISIVSLVGLALATVVRRMRGSRERNHE